MDPPKSTWSLVLLAAVWLAPGMARGQDAAGLSAQRQGDPSWSWPVQTGVARGAMRIGVAAPEEAGEPLSAVALEALARWRALRATVDVSVSRAVAVEAPTTIVGHASLAWGDAAVRPVIDLELSASAGAWDTVALRAGPAIAAQGGDGHSLIAATTYASDGREVRVDVVYSLALNAGM